MCLDEIDNRLGPDGARYISDMLRENSTLLYLDIGGACFHFLFDYFFLLMLLMKHFCDEV